MTGHSSHAACSASPHSDERSAGHNHGADFLRASGQPPDRVVIGADLLRKRWSSLSSLLAGRLGGIFIGDPPSLQQRRVSCRDGASYFLFGQMMVLSGYFQALGDPLRAVPSGWRGPICSCCRLTFLLPYAFARPGIWMVSVVAGQDESGVAGAVAECQAVRLAIRASAKLKRESRAIAGAASNGQN